MSSPTTNEVSSEKGEDGEKKCHRKKMCRPKKLRAVVDSVKQSCWCGEEWQDYHEDGKHGPVWVEVEK
jgi:hypothetical protein